MESKPNHHQAHQPERANHQRRESMRKTSSWNSESSSQMDSPHSPLRFHSPLRSEAGDPPETPPYESPVNSLGIPAENSKAIVAVEKVNSVNHKKAPAPAPTVIFNRTMKEDAPASVAKVGPVAGGSVTEEYGNERGGRRSSFASAAGKRPRREEMLKSAALGFRVSECVLCLISFSVMAADKTQGWSGDSFDRYKEYRYCLSVNVIAFVYSLFQTFDLANHLATGKHVVRHHLRRHFVLFMDQVLTYLLISAASSAATRVDDWVSNWGKDDFTQMATVSVVMAFLGFAAFAVSSLISGYDLWTENSV